MCQAKQGLMRAPVPLLSFQKTRDRRLQQGKPLRYRLMLSFLGQLGIKAGLQETQVGKLLALLLL